MHSFPELYAPGAKCAGRVSLRQDNIRFGREPPLCLLVESQRLFYAEYSGKELLGKRDRVTLECPRFEEQLQGKHAPQHMYQVEIDRKIDRTH
jgi:hypothetical protein